MIRDDAERRAKLTALKRQVRELEKPEREAAKIARAKSRARREAALVRTDGQREPRVKEPAYLQWVRRLPCVICGTTNRVEAAHIRSGYSAPGWPPTGMAQKPSDFRCAPLCATCHREGPDSQHRANERAWWACHGIDPPDFCAALRAAYLAGTDGLAVIHRFSPSIHGAE